MDWVSWEARWLLYSAPKEPRSTAITADRRWRTRHSNAAGASPSSSLTPASPSTLRSPAYLWMWWPSGARHSRRLSPSPDHGCWIDQGRNQQRAYRSPGFRAFHRLAPHVRESFTGPRPCHHRPLSRGHGGCLPKCQHFSRKHREAALFLGAVWRQSRHQSRRRSRRNRGPRLAHAAHPGGGCRATPE